METKKSPKADLEKRRILFLEIGLALALAICFIAFEWNTEEIETKVLSITEINEIETEIVLPDVIIKEKEKLTKPETVIVELVIVENDVETENIIIESEADENTKTKTTIIINIINDDPIIIEDPVEIINFAKVEERPAYPGGDVEMLRFLKSKCKYPEEPKLLGIDGTVYVQFVIGVDGSISNVTIAHGIDKSLDAEAIRIVKLMPKWSPGKQRGIPVPVTRIIPIKFILE